MSTTLLVHFSRLDEKSELETIKELLSIDTDFKGEEPGNLAAEIFEANSILKHPVERWDAHIKKIASLYSMELESQHIFGNQAYVSGFNSEVHIVDEIVFIALAWTET